MRLKQTIRLEILGVIVAMIFISACSRQDVTQVAAAAKDNGKVARNEAAHPDPATTYMDDQPPGSWRSELYTQDWEPAPALSFATDKIIQDFSYAGYARGERPIPTFEETPVVNVLDFDADPTGEADSTQAIQRAINHAASLKTAVVVYLPEGIYRISPPAEKPAALSIRKSGMVLRGDGADKTYLYNDSYQMRGKAIISVSAPATASWRQEQAPVIPIVQDLPSPTRTLPVADSSHFKVGDTIIIRADPTSEWIEEHREDGWLGHGDRLGSMLYLRRIEWVDYEQHLLTIDIPTRYTLKQSYNARIYQKTGLLGEIGLEHFSIGNREHPGKDGWGTLDFALPKHAYTKRLAEGYQLDSDFANERKSAADVHFSYAIAIAGVTNGWIRNVHTYRPDANRSDVELLSNGIRLKECQHVSVINCVMAYPQYGGGGGNGYMYRLDNSNDCLLDNCTAAYSRHGFSISGMASSGNVLYRCLDIETGRQVAGTGQTTGRGSDHHMWFSHSNLIDNCVAENSWYEARDRYYANMSEPKHNSVAAHTVFWNTEGSTGGKWPFVVWSDQAKYGYIIGTCGTETRVRLDSNYPERTHVSGPEDHAEGIGEGDTLYPQSLFQNQRQRRLAALSGSVLDSE